MSKRDLFEYTPATGNDWSYLDKFFGLLAEENLTVRRSKKAKTASINTATRVITIPDFSTADKDTFLMFGSHEVSHALHTPPNWSHSLLEQNMHNGTLRMCFNVVEDIRIEKLIRNKFPGFAAIYVRAYAKLLNSNWFSLNHFDRFNIADRINVKAKLGKNMPFELNDFDDGVYRYVSSCMTFDDVIEKSCFLYKLVVAEKNKRKEEKEDEKKEKKEEPLKVESESDDQPDVDDQESAQDESEQGEKQDDPEAGDSEESGDGESGEPSDEGEESDETEDGDSDGDDGDSDGDMLSENELKKLEKEAKELAERLKSDGAGAGDGEEDVGEKSVTQEEIDKAVEVDEKGLDRVIQSAPDFKKTKHVAPWLSSTHSSNALSSYF